MCTDEQVTTAGSSGSVLLQIPRETDSGTLLTTVLLRGEDLSTSPCHSSTENHSTGLNSPACGAFSGYGPHTLGRANNSGRGMWEAIGLGGVRLQVTHPLVDSGECGQGASSTCCNNHRSLNHRETVPDTLLQIKPSRSS